MRETQREDGDGDKYVEKRRRDGKSRITNKKRRRGRGLHYVYGTVSKFIIKEASTGNVIIPKCEMCV